MPRPALLLLVLLFPAAAAQEPALPERLRDDFAADSRDDYRSEGEVSWRKGTLTLGPGAALRRTLGLGHTAEVEVTLAFPEGTEAAELRLRLSVGAQGPLVVLRRDKEEVRLTDRTDQAGPAAALNPGAPAAWRLRVHLGYGLLRAKAWPEGRAEPDGWALTRYRVGLHAAPIPGVRLESAGARAVALRHLSVRGEAPADLTNAQRELARQAINRDQEAQARWQQGNAAAALPLCAEALALHRRAFPAGHPLIGPALHNLALVHGELGRTDKAKALNEEALALRRRALPAGHPDIAYSLSGLATDYLTLGQPAKAQELFAEALAIRRATLPADHPLTILSLHNLAVTYAKQGRVARATELFAEALAVRRRTLRADHPDIVRNLHNLGLTYRALGQAEKARAFDEEALALARKALPPGHPLIALNLNGLATAYIGLGQPARARPLFEEALAIRRKALPAGHPEITDGLVNLALTYRELGRADDAWGLLLEACEAEAGYLVRVLAGSPQRDHLPLLARADSRGDLLALAEATRPTAKGLRTLFAQVAARQALAGLAAQRRHEAALVGADAAAGARYARLQEVRQRLADLLLRGAPPGDVAGYRRRCEDLQREQDRLERALAQALPGYAPLTEAARADPARLAAALADGEVFLHLVAYAGGDAGRYAALLLWREDGGPQVRFVPLGEAGRIDAAVRSWRAGVQKGGVPDGPGRVLREALWEPVAKALPAGARRLAVVPEGQLALLPLGALRLADGAYVIEKFAVRSVSSARDLISTKGKATGPAVLVSDPAFDLAAGAGAKAGTAGPEERPPALGRGFRRLPGFAREAAAAEKLLRTRPGWDVRLLRGEGATEEAVAAVKRPRLLYLITHGFFLEDVRPRAVGGLRDLDLADLGGPGRRPALGPDPRLRSGLALTGANRWQERSEKGASDGLLTAAEVENLDLVGTELVILSACETGLGEVQNGEGVLGLRRAFQLAGAQTVVASLWKVPDDQTEQLMTGFLKRWLDGTGKADALRQAQLDLIRQLRKSADPALRGAPPLYWAGFVCHGRPD